MVPPLIERELRVALRRKARQQWLVAAWTAGALTLFSMLMLGLASNRSAGRTLFQWLFGLGIVGVLTRGFGLTADLFSAERRNGTLGLVVLTGLRPLEIFAWKLLGALMLAAYALLGGLPFFAIPFLTGGVPIIQFVCALVFLVNGLFFCVAVGLLASVVHRDGGQAQFMGQALAAGLCVPTPLLHWFSSLAGRPGLLSADWLALSPAYAPYLVFTGFAKGSSHFFWVGSAITLGYTLTALLLAALILQCTWRDGTGTVAAGRLSKRWRAWTRGGQRWRDRLRARFLTDQPFCWLAARERPPVVAAYGVLAVVGSIWLAGWAAAGLRWLTPVNAFISSILLHQALNLVGAYAAGRHFAEERLSGGFEVLLTAPLRAADIVEGQAKALLVQFRGVAVIVLLFDAVFCWSGFAALDSNPVRAVAYLLGWVLLLGYWFAMHLASASRAMWIGAWTGRPGYAAMKAGGNYWLLLVWVWIFSRPVWGAMFQKNPYQLAYLGLLVIPILLTFSLRFVLRQKLSRELRLIASAPIPDRGDSRFKKWDPNKIFPPDPCGELGPKPPGRRVNEPRGRMDTLNG